MTCIDKDTALAYVSGFLDPAEADAWATHLAHCAACQLAVEEVSELLDHTRRTLSAGDGSLDGTIPSIDTVRHRGPAHEPRGFVLRAGRRAWPGRLAVAAGAVAIVSGAAYFVATRDAVQAAEVLSRAAEVTINARTIPDRVIHRAWRASLSNGYGPLPDGDYTENYWWDNVRHRYAYTCHDGQGRLREGTWHLADGSFRSFQAYDLAKPVLVIGPPAADVLTEIATLPPGVRERVDAYFRRMRRPYYTLADESQDRTANELKEIAQGRIADSSIHDVVFPSGQKLYRVTTHTDISRPGASIIHWDVTRLILDGSYLTMEVHTTGYRADGLIYGRARRLTREEVFTADEADRSAFSPSEFPAATAVHHVSARRRVESMQRALEAEEGNR